MRPGSLIVELRIVGHPHPTERRMAGVPKLRRRTPGSDGPGLDEPRTTSPNKNDAPARKPCRGASDPKRTLWERRAHAYPAGQPLPITSALNFRAGITRANNAIIALDSSGQISAFCDMPSGSVGAMHFVLDVYGYFQ